MNRTNIEWTDFTWKIYPGCLHGCPYCYVKRTMKDMTPVYHPERLNQPLRRKKPSMIFVNNTGDLFGEWVSDSVIKDIISIVKLCPQHIFQFLTKNPYRYLDWDWSECPNAWLGATIENEDSAIRIIHLKATNAHIKFASYEPILGFIKHSIKGLGWVIIGAESIGRASNPRDVVSAQRYAKPLIERVRKAGIPLFLKPNLQWPEKIQEFPKFKTPTKGGKDEQTQPK